MKLRGEALQVELEELWDPGPMPSVSEEQTEQDSSASERVSLETLKTLTVGALRAFSGFLLLMLVVAPLNGWGTAIAALSALVLLKHDRLPGLGLALMVIVVVGGIKLLCLFYVPDHGGLS